MARNVSNGYNPPNIKLITKDLLDVIHGHNIQRDLIMIKKNADIFGLLFLGDGNTIYRTTLLICSRIR